MSWLKIRDVAPEEVQEEIGRVIEEEYQPRIEFSDLRLVIRSPFFLLLPYSVSRRLTHLLFECRLRFS